MEDAAVIAGLVPPDLRLLFQHRHAAFGEAAAEFEGSGEADDASADDDKLSRVQLFGGKSRAQVTRGQAREWWNSPARRAGHAGFARAISPLA